MRSEIADCCNPDVPDTFEIVNFYNPEGTFIEIAGSCSPGPNVRSYAAMKGTE